MFKKCVCGLCVSTHSRLKAAGGIYCACINPILSFNTQPPKGGWGDILRMYKPYTKFQHTAARRRLGMAVVAKFG